LLLLLLSQTITLIFVLKVHSFHVHAEERGEREHQQNDGKELWQLNNNMFNNHFEDGRYLVSFALLLEI
jgi:hypothetical protein